MLFAFQILKMMANEGMDTDGEVPTGHKAGGASQISELRISEVRRTKAFRRFRDQEGGTEIIRSTCLSL
jgi:hypothetical protein